MTVKVAPCVRSVRAASSDILPAPTIRTRRRAKSPTTWRANSTATELTETGFARDCGLAAHAAGDAERAFLEAGPEDGAGRSVLDGGVVGLLGLAEDLRLAHHQRVQAGRDPEQVADRRRVAVLVEVLGEIGDRDAGPPREHAGEIGGRAIRVVGGDVQLDAVARGDHRRLADRRQRGQLDQRGSGRVRLDRQALAHRDRAPSCATHR